MDEKVDLIEGELCPFCNNKTLTLMENTREVPFFGICHLFSMNCSTCKYHKADVEAEAKHAKAKYTFELSSEEDLKVRVIKSSNATVKIGNIATIEPGEAANGYITNIEGLLNRITKQIESLRELAKGDGDDAAYKKAKNHLKKLQRALWGQEKLKIVVDDPSGNSAIISEKAVKK